MGAGGGGSTVAIEWGGGFCDREVGDGRVGDWCRWADECSTEDDGEDGGGRKGRGWGNRSRGLLLR